MLPQSQKQSSAQPAAPEAAERPPQLSLDPAPTVADKPAEDGWQTEVLADDAKHVLQDLAAHAGLTAAGAAPVALDALVSADAAVQPLRPAALQRVFNDGRVAVHRRAAAPGPQATVDRGPQAVMRAFAELANPWRGVAPPRVAWKVVGVQQAGDGLTVSAFYEAWGETTLGAAEQHALGQFQFARKEGHLLLTAARLDDFEEATRTGKAALLTEVTPAVIGQTPGYATEMLVGTPAWLLRTETAAASDVIGHQGLAVADVNGDGLDDLYVLQPAGVPNRLYVQQTDGTAQERSAQAGLDWLDRTRAALFVDLDNDGDQDLAATIAWADTATTRALAVHENDGQGRFAERARLLLGTDLYGLAAADYDNDGDIDLYACQFNPGDVSAAGFGAPLPYHDANNGGRNALLRNDGKFTFVDATQAVGLEHNNRRWSYSATWEDFDNDGDVDLHVANDHGRDNLYRNDGGTFRDVAPEIGVDDVSAGMSSSWGDYDRDGDLDLYVGNMFSSAGRRIASQAQFQASAGDAIRSHYQRHAQGNSLFRFDGTRFGDVTLDSGTTLGRWAWSSVFADLDNDGWQDLLVANGMFTGHDPVDL